MNTDDLKAAAYKTLEQLFEAINSGGSSQLSQKFDISPAVYSEIRENLDEYFVDGWKIALAPLDTAFERIGGSRPSIDVYPMNDNESFGIECVIWTDGKPKEPILHAELVRGEAGYGLRFNYIGS